MSGQCLAKDFQPLSRAGCRATIIRLIDNTQEAQASSTQRANYPALGDPLLGARGGVQSLRPLLMVALSWGWV